MRSFVRREGRITDAQKQALEDFWPQYGISYTGTPVHLPELFGRNAPVELEIGCGNGDALLEMASARPDHDFIGIEVYRPGVGKLLRGAKSAELNNIRICSDDATDVVQRGIAESSLTRVMVFFPDPWPKKRHHKRRLLQPGFVHLLATRLIPGGKLHVATDWREYAEFVMETVCAEKLLRNRFGPRAFAPRPEQRPQTKYERRGQRLGHGVYDIIVERT